MDQQTPNAAPKRALTVEEIARLEAEAVAALQRGETPAQLGESPAQPGGAENAGPDSEAPMQPDFVPYVDDVAPAPQDAADGEGEDDTPYVPGKWEARVNALTDRQWRLWQIAGGAALGLVVVLLLFIGSEELSTYRLLVAALLALLLPRYLERTLRRDLNVARRAMIVALVVGLAIVFVIIGSRNGFNFTQKA